MKLSEATLEKETMKAAHEELQTTVATFVEKDAEIKKLFDMFETTLKAVSEENAEFKEKFDTLLKENESLKEMVVEYQKDLGDAKEQLFQASKFMEEFQQMKRNQINQRVTTMTESTVLGRRSEPTVIDERPSYNKPTATTRSNKPHTTSHDPKIDLHAEIERIDEEEDQESSSQMYKETLKSKKKREAQQKESKSKHSEDLAYLRESNKLLKRQNESLMLQTKLIEEKTKLEKDDYSKVS